MRYNFDVVTDRWNTNAVKYDEAEKKFGRKDLIPLWIADMDLPTAQPIIDAMAKRNAQEYSDIRHGPILISNL